MKILVIGPIEKDKISAANKFMINLIRSLKPVSVSALSVHTIPLYPYCEKIYLAKEEATIEDDIKFIRLASINLPLLREVYIFINTFLYCLKWLRENKAITHRRIVIYNMKPPIPMACYWATKIMGGRVVGIIADIPFNYKFSIRGKKYNYGKKGMGGFLQCLDCRSQIKWLKKMHGLITLSEFTIKDFDYKKPYILMEGGSNKEEVSEGKYKNSKICEKVAMFCGSIHPIHGIDLLLQTWDRLPNEYKLIICGRGPDEEKVREFCLTHNNVEYRGIVPYEELFDLQRSVDLLLVPHPIDVRHIRYQFPSKIFEYMNSGTPILTTPLPTLPEDYLQYMYVSTDASPQGYGDEIIKIMGFSKEQRCEKGRAAKKFVRENKNWELQGRRILDFLGNTKG